MHAFMTAVLLRMAWLGMINAKKYIAIVIANVVIVAIARFE
jgi:predicted small integral membrane protein